MEERCLAMLTAKECLQSAEVCLALAHKIKEKMSNRPLAREPIDRMRAREALLKANAAPRCGARSKRTGKPCRGAAMPNGRCKLHGGKSTGPRTPEGLERSRRANWKHGHFSRAAKAERLRLRAAILALRDLCDAI